MPFDGPVILYGAMVECHPISVKLIEITSIWSKSLARKFFGCALYAVKIWKRDILVADIEELRRMDASEIHSRRLNAKEVLTTMNGEKFIFQSQMVHLN